MYPPPAPRGAVVQCYPRSARAARPSSSRPSPPKPGQRRGDHISFVIGPFHPRSGPPCNPGASGTEPPSRACWNQRSQRETRAATSGAAWPTPPAAPACVILLQTSHRAGTRVAPAVRCAYRALALPVPWSPGLLWVLFLHNSPETGSTVCARVPFFLRFAASRNAGYWD